MAINIGGMRRPYKSSEDTLLEEDLTAKEPIALFKDWFEEACRVEGIEEPNAMCLATATNDGVPSARMVLLKSYGKEGFKFFTNYDSRKGRELRENPVASLCFYWAPLKRSVRVEGAVQRVPELESQEYFRSRPRPSQLGACVSKQSEVIASRATLTAKHAELEHQYTDSCTPVPMPKNWGGFLLVPRVVEFWQGQSTRLHDRICFRRLEGEDRVGECGHEGEDGWMYERLSP